MAQTSRQIQHRVTTPRKSHARLIAAVLGLVACITVLSRPSDCVAAGLLTTQLSAGASFNYPNIGDSKSSTYAAVDAGVDFFTAFGFSESAYGSARFGSVGASVSYLESRYTQSAISSPLVQANATALDTITFLGGTGTGTAQLAFSLEGSAISSEAYVGGYMGFRAWYVRTDTGETADILRVNSHDGFPAGIFLADPFSFTYGESILFGISILTELSTILEGPATPVPVFAQVDYLHTATWSGVTVTDASGAPNTTFTISSASGTQYPLAAAAVPEPSAWVLMLGGILPVAAPWVSRRLRANPAGNAR